MIGIRSLVAIAAVALAVPAAAAAQAPTFSYGSSNFVGEYGVNDVGYCAVAGNTWPKTGTIADGTPIAPGTFLDLVGGQPSWDPHYKGAVPANYVIGIGLTCSNPPAGYVQEGTTTNAMGEPEGLYPVYGPPAGPAPQPAAQTTTTAASTLVEVPTFSYGPSNFVGEAGVLSAAYCSVAGDTWPKTGTIADGTPIAPGTFLELVAGQPSWDPHYKGAVPASYVIGAGLTCNNPPAGDVQQGMSTNDLGVPAGLYPVYGPPKA